jgi:hypothetical protein
MVKSCRFRSDCDNPSVIGDRRGVRIYKPTPGLIQLQLRLRFAVQRSGPLSKHLSACLPFTILSQPYTANGNGVFQANGPEFARRVPGQPLYHKTPVAGVTAPGTRQWLNPNAFVSVVDPTIGACTGGDSAANCQFGNSGRNTARGPHFTDSDIYFSRGFPMWEQTSLRFDVQMFSAFNHPKFALPSSVEVGVPGEYIPPKFGTLEGTISPPTGL